MLSIHWFLGISAHLASQMSLPVHGLVAGMTCWCWWLVWLEWLNGDSVNWSVLDCVKYQYQCSFFIVILYNYYNCCIIELMGCTFKYLYIILLRGWLLRLYKWKTVFKQGKRHIYIITIHSDTFLVRSCFSFCLSWFFCSIFAWEFYLSVNFSYSMSYRNKNQMGFNLFRYY